MSRSFLNKLYLYALAVFLCSNSMIAAPPVIMKVLVLAGSTSEPSYQSITTYLDQIGVPYQAVVLNSITPDSSGNRLSQVPLSDSASSRGLYQGIILTDSTFAACNPSCLSTADWTTLNTYASAFSVRIASYYTYPEAQWGLLPADSGGSYTTASPLNVTLTTAGAAVFPYLNAASTIPVAGQGSIGIWVYRALPTAAANETTTPLLTAGSYTVAVTHSTSDGREILALTMDNYPTLLHSIAFGYGVVNWVTKGVFLGSRRVYLNPQIDDMLLGNRLYAPTLPQCPNDESCPIIYATGQDIQALVNWQDQLKEDPLFSTFHSTFAFNGVGTTWFDPSDPVFAAISSLGSNFSWLSHTWDHPQIDCYATDSNGNCIPATLAQSQSELNQNIAIAQSLGINLDRTSMVTPFNGGLGDADFITAAVQAGLQYIVTAVPPPTPNTGIVNPLNSSIFEVPRVTPNLFDDVSVPQTGAYGSWTDEYNATFGPGGTQPIYSQNQTYDQILDNESTNVLLGTMLTYEPYLLAFHIDNSSTYDGTHSLYSDLLDSTIGKYESLFTLPVVTLDMKDLAPVLQTRASYNASGVSGVYTPGVSVVLTTTNAATIPVTGACAQVSCGTYGGQIQDNIVMTANSTLTLSLTASQNVTLSSVWLDPTSVTGGTSSTGTVTLGSLAPSGGVLVALASNNSSAIVPGSVTVAAGSSTGTFTVTTNTVTSSASATITATYSGVSQTASLAITPVAPSLSSVSVAPTGVNGGTLSVGTLTLSGAAPAGGFSVSLSSNNAAASVPASVTVPAGSTTSTFTITTNTVTSSTSATITASYNNATQSAFLTITPAVTVTLSSVSVNPNSVTAGTPATGTVVLSSAAPAGGLVVALWTNGSPAFVPVSTTIAAGSTTGTFSVTTISVSTTMQGTITAFYNGQSQTTSITVTPAVTVALSSVSVSPASVTGGTSMTGTVTLSAAAPTGGLVVPLWTNGTPAFVPVSITIAAGSTTGTFNVTTTSVSATTQDTVTAFYNGQSVTTIVSVTP